MKAIFDKHCNCVGWYDENKEMVYNTELSWIGFITNGYFFSPNTEWIGAMKKGTFVDKNGKPVAWIEGATPVATSRLAIPLRPLRPFRPLRPLKPLRPFRPLRPMTPIGGWSTYSWEEYIN